MFQYSFQMSVVQTVKWFHTVNIFTVDLLLKMSSSGE